MSIKKKQLREKYKKLSKQYYETYLSNSQESGKIGEVAEEEIKLGVGKGESEMQDEQESELG